MRRRGAAALLAASWAAGASAAAAGDVEISLHAALSVPFYRESFAYDPGPFAFSVPGVTVTQGGVFTLDGRGGFGGGGALAWQVFGPLALEARVDAGRVRVATTGARYDVRIDLPAPLPDLATQTDLGSADAGSAWLVPVSLNLRARTPGPVALTASGGLSYLPEPRLALEQSVGLGMTGFSAVSGRVDVATLSLLARATAEDERSRFGLNAGLGVQVPLAPRVRLHAEARYFRFGRQRLRWERASGPPRSLVEERLLTEVERLLPEPSFRPAFFQATAGLALRL